MLTRDLWPGADVRWIGPDTERHGVRLRPGDLGVVVDAGRHQVTSFSAMHDVEGARRPRPGRGVTVRLAGRATVSVPRKHLKLVAPDHPLAPEPDGTLADWWLQQLRPWGRQGIPVDAFVPSSFAAVGQVLHPASPGELDQTMAAALVDVLTEATTTPDDVFVAVWEGWGDVPPQRFPGAARLDIPGRGHFLLRGPLRGVLASVAASVHDRLAAGLWWPADRAWFVSTEIDFEWTFVAGTDEVVDRLIDDDRLEVARTAFDAAANQAGEPETFRESG